MTEEEAPEVADFLGGDFGESCSGRGARETGVRPRCSL